MAQHKKTKAEIFQEKVESYRRLHGLSSVDLRDVAAWMIRQGWQLKPRDAAKVLRKELAVAMRQEYMEDPQGRRIRRNHAERLPHREGQQKQGVLWHDIATATRPQMQAAFQQRRQGIVMDCRQLQQDVDSFNTNWNTSIDIQMVFDFEEDLEELDHED